MTAAQFDAIIVNGGLDALVAACVLGKAGRRVLYLSRGPNVASLADEPIEIAPGFRAPLRLDADWVPPSVLRELGVKSARNDTLDVPTSVALPGGGILPLPASLELATSAIRAHSPRDAERWGAFTTRMRALAGFLEGLYQLPPTDIDGGTIGDLPSLLGLGRSFRALGKTNMGELLRVMPMPAQDLADEWFDFEPLRAAVGAAAIRDIRQGPRSGGTSFVLLHHLVGAGSGVFRGRSVQRSGGTHAVSIMALAEQLAVQRGLVIRANSDVTRVVVRDDAVTGVALATGEEFAAPMVLANDDPARTLLRMVDPMWLDPEFLLAVQNIKFRGSTAFVLYALDESPASPDVSEAALEGIVSLSTSLDGIEKAYDAAKYGRMSEQPHIEITVPSLRSADLAPAGKHVLVAKVQYAPHTLRGSQWDAAATAALAFTVTAAISRIIPQLKTMTRARVVVTPRDIEARFGLTDGALNQGEITLDQILFMRPVPGWGQYASPIRGLYLGGPGTHPGPGIRGASGLLAARRMLADSKKRR